MITHLLIGGNEMDCLLAKVKKEEKLRKVLADKKVYQKPTDLNGAIEYDCARTLDDDEWFQLTEFSKKEFCIELLKTDFRSTDYTLIDTATEATIEFICAYQNDEFYFQRIFKHNILAKQRLLHLGDNIKIEENEKGIVLNAIPDAIYIENEDKLYFKKLQTISPIFNSIDSLFKEATREETEEFLNNDFVDPVDGYSAEKVKNMNRKRIAMAMETLKGFSEKQKKAVLEYTHTYYPELKYEKGKFSVSTEDDMKYLLWGIEQRYYTTPVTKEQRVANSTTTLRQK